MIEGATHIYGVWMIPSRDDTRDWLGQLFVRDGKWTLRYRFRYYSEESTSPHDDKDRKSWYTGSQPDNSHESFRRALAGVNQVVPLIEQELGGKADFILLDCKPDDPKVFFEISSRPWAHVKMVKEQRT